MPHKLLLADDSVTIQRVIELTFADEDVTVTAVGDGQKAIASIQSNRPDIVLADVGMPERDGYEVAAFVKGNPDLAHIPVLLLTGAFEPIDETRARAVGCDGVLVKPFEPQMVINRVKDLLAGRRPAGLWTATPGAPAARQPAGSDFDLHAAPAPQSPAAGGGSLEDYFDRLDAAFASLDGSPQPSVPAAAARPPATFAPQPSTVPLDTPDVRPAAQQGGLAGDDLEGWDPDLAGDPTRPAGADWRPAPELPRVPPAAPPPAQSQYDPAHYDAPPVAPSYAPPPAAPVYAPPAAAAPQPSAPQPSPLPAAAMPSLAEAFAALLSAEQSQPVTASAIAGGSVPDATIDDIVQRVVSRMSDQAVRDTVVDVAERLVREEIARIKSQSR